MIKFSEGSAVKSYAAGSLKLVDGTVTGIEYQLYARPVLYLANTMVVAAGRWGRDAAMQSQWMPGDVGFMPPDQDWDCRPTTHEATMMVTTSENFCAAVREHVDVSQLEFRFSRIRNPTTTYLFKALREVATSGHDQLSDVTAQTIGLALGASVLRAMFPSLTQKLEQSTGLSIARRRRVLEYIETQLSERITIAELADVASLSQWHFCRSFQRSVGMSPARYIMSRRIDLARRLLSGRLPAQEVAMACGFASHSHFCDAFRRVVGRTPGEYREASR